MGIPSKEIIQAERLMNSGKYDEALLILNNYEKESGLNASVKLTCHLLQSIILKYLGSCQESYKFVEKAYQVTFKSKLIWFFLI